MARCCWELQQFPWEPSLGIPNWAEEKTFHRQGHEPLKDIGNWQPCPSVWSGETGLKSRGDLKEIGLEWASRGGQVWVGTERGRIPWPEAQQDVHRGFQFICPKDTVQAEIGKAGHGHTVRRWSVLSLMPQQEGWEAVVVLGRRVLQKGLMPEGEK